MNARLALVLLILAGCGRIVGMHDLLPADAGLHADAALPDAAPDLERKKDSGLPVDAARIDAAFDIAIDQSADKPGAPDCPPDGATDGPDGATGDALHADTTPEETRDAVSEDAAGDAYARDTVPDALTCPASSWEFARSGILSNTGLGACGYDLKTLPAFVASIDDKGFDGARGCGMCLRLVPGRTDVITKYVDVLVIDQAGGGDSARQVNISRQAMAALASPSTDNLVLSFKVIPCSSPLVAPNIRIAEMPGSTPQYLALQIRDYALPLKTVDVWFAGAWASMAFTLSNTWVFESDGIVQPYTFRLTNSLGDVLTIDDLGISEGVLTDTGKQFPNCVP